MNSAIKIRMRRATTLSSTSLLALTLFFCNGTAAIGQDNPSTMPPQYQGENHQGENHNDITRQEIASMDRFLDGHPEIAEQLRKDPARINNREFVENHPALREYLQQHPNVRQEFSENPNAFMKRENRYEGQEDRDHDRDRDRDRDRGRDNDTSRRDLREMDRFLDNHREIAEQLRKDPSLINNREWVENHPDLREFLQKNPGVREEIRENPNAFMHQENRYDRREGDRREGDLRAGDRDHDRDHEARTGDDRGELTSFGQFLGGHSNVASELSRDPSLATNKEYLANHPELDEYLKAHPTMSQQLTANPQGVMSSTWVQQGNSSMGAKQTTPKEMPKEKPPNQ